MTGGFPAGAGFKLARERWGHARGTEVALQNGLSQWWGQDSNLRRLSQRVYSPSPLTAREPHRAGVESSAGGRGGASPRAVASPPVSGIGVLREGPLHAALKAWLAEPGDVMETRVDGYVIDLVRADGELVELQTGGFSPLRGKLDALLDRHRMRIVHPVAAERRIVRVGPGGEVVSARRSPRRAGPAAIFDGLVSFPTLLGHPNLTVEVLLCREDHVRAPAPVRGRRYTRDPGERRLLEVLERVVLAGPADVAALAPAGRDGEPFTTRELAARMGVPLALARRAAACLLALGVLEPAGRRGAAPLHRRTC